MQCSLLGHKICYKIVLACCSDLNQRPPAAISKIYDPEIFSDPNLLSQVYRDFLTRLLEEHKEHLPAEAAALLGAELDHEQFCTAWAAQFSSPTRFGTPLREALLAIEHLARPENENLLKDTLSHLPPGYEVNQNLSSLHQALHLWLIAQNTPGVSWPEGRRTEGRKTEDRSAASRPSEGGTGARTPEDGGQKTETELAAEGGGRAPALENQNSKIENPEDTFRRLAHLSPVEYDLVRHAEAKRLHLRLATLDDAVERARILEDDAQANALKLPQLEPWPEPITDAPALFDAIHERCLLYLHLPPGAAVVLTLWPAHAHAIKVLL